MSEFAKPLDKVGVPVTKGTAEGSAKRNILRKDKKVGGGNKGKKLGSKDILDDGSTYQDPYALDEHDPNYDSEEDNGEEYVSVMTNRYDSGVRSELPAPSLSLKDYKMSVEKALNEFFVSADIPELQTRITELNVPQFSYELVKRAVSMSLDRADLDRELVSQLLSASYPDLLSTNTIGKGFERLFEIVDEIEKDVPKCKDYVSTFLARCVIDEVLPPSFLTDTIVYSLGGDIIDHARVKLSREHAGALLERAWGPGDGRPVAELKQAVDIVLQEYILALDLAEATRCIKELSSIYFYHEIVKRAITNSLDKDMDKQIAMSELIAFLVLEQNVCSIDQCVFGFNLVYDTIRDISLDIPGALDLVDKFKERALELGVLPANYVPKIQA